MFSSKVLVVLSIACLSVGVIFFTYQQHFFCIHFPHQKTFDLITPSTHAQQSHLITLYYFIKGGWKTQTTTVVWTTSRSQNIQTLTTQLLTLLQEKEIIKKPTNIDSVLLSKSEQHAYISFDHNPFDKQQSIATKATIILSILKTITENDPLIRSVTFLIRHQLLQDPHLNFLIPWPIALLESTEHTFLHTPLPTHLQIKQKDIRQSYLIMLNAHGTQHGRTFNHEYEKSIIFFFMQKLKQELEEASSEIQVIISRWSATLDELNANIQIANRMQPNLFINIQCYKEANTIPAIHLFQFSSGKDFLTQTPELWFCPKEDAYLNYQKITDAYSKSLHTFLTQHLHKICTISSPQKIISNALCGLCVPAFTVELGLRKDDDWKLFVPLLAQGIKEIVQKYKKY